MIEVEDLGIISFESAYRYQKECVEKIRTNNSPGKLLLMEHYDCITAGMSTTRDEIGQLKKCKFDSKVSIIETDRGGKITAHNVGQLIGYPIINLKLAKLSIIKFIEKVLTCVSRAVGYFQITPKVVIEKNRTGLWIDDRKICFLGIKVSQFITYHGFALNVNNDLTIFNYFTPCGIPNCKVTSIEKELGRKVDMNFVKQKISSVFITSF